MEYLRTCPTCGKRFTTTANRKVYCSARCQRLAFQRRQRSEARAEEQQQKQAEDRKWKQEADARAKRRWREIEKSASNGDPLAIMQVTSKTDPRYWEAYAAYVIGYAEAMGKTSTDTVNGISVYSDHFGDEVVESIEESGSIATRS